MSLVSPMDSHPPLLHVRLRMYFFAFSIYMCSVVLQRISPAIGRPGGPGVRLEVRRVRLKVRWVGLRVRRVGLDSKWHSC